MYRIREFEDAVDRLFARGQIRGSTHLCQGQEAVSAGVCSALRLTDTMFCTYRGHGQVIAKGADLTRALGEILGREQGLCKGKGGSLHLADFSVGALGSNGIVGAPILLATGAALTEQYLGRDGVSVAFFGDGAANIGAFHEGLNLAGVWKLPVVFVLENNHYGEYSPLASTTPIERLSDRAGSYGMPGVHVDGNDVIAVRDAAVAAVDRARRGAGPTLIEADTYRQVGHSRTDTANYRPDGELEEWKLRDPLVLFDKLLMASGVPADDLRQMRRTVREEIDIAVTTANGWSAPNPEARFEDIFA
jgi:TPP-dependent pyruvate/acetoin dehydrogenase alpha subunit